jgi:hypothetical protein
MGTVTPISLMPKLKISGALPPVPHMLSWYLAGRVLRETANVCLDSGLLFEFIIFCHFVHALRKFFQCTYNLWQLKDFVYFPSEIEVVLSKSGGDRLKQPV